jgi:hypothetical protein
MVLPVLARARQPVAPGVQLVRILLPPGLWVGFGLDLGPVVGHVSTADLERWQVDEPTIVATAIANLERRAHGRELEVSSVVLDGVPITLVQASGWGSSLLLVPSVLDRLLGRGPHQLFAPIRNTIVCLPVDAPDELIALLWSELATDEPTELDGGIYRLEDGRLEPLAPHGPGEALSAAFGLPHLPN